MSGGKNRGCPNCRDGVWDRGGGGDLRSEEGYVLELYVQLRGGRPFKNGGSCMCNWFLGGMMWDPGR